MILVYKMGISPNSVYPLRKLIYQLTKHDFIQYYLILGNAGEQPRQWIDPKGFASKHPSDMVTEFRPV